MSNKEKTIYLARHAKSAWDSGAPSDFDRPLSRRGVTDIMRIGAELKRLKWYPDKIISSPALRAKQTCQTLCDQLSFPFDKVVWSQDIYAAYTVTLIQLLSVLPESVTRVMLIGHNPAMEDLLVHFCSDAKAYRQKNGKLFTTGNIVKVTTQSSWKDVAMCEANLEKILRPKEL